jgi:Ca2+:H+ antiporter
VISDHASASDTGGWFSHDAPAPPDGSLHGLLILSRGTAIILLSTYIAYLFFQLRTHAQLFVSEAEQEEEVADMDQYSAGIWLLIVTTVTAFSADILVGSIDDTATTWNIPKAYG